MNTAETFVQSNIEKTYAIINGNDPTREAEFLNLLRSIVDTRRVAQFTLGPYARQVSRADFETFCTSFTGLLVAVYQRGLERYKGQSVVVIGSTEHSAGDVIVNVVAGNQAQANSKARIDFRVRRRADGSNAIIDLQVEGVWLALMQRDEFIAFLQQHHGDVAALSIEVERKAEQLRSGTRKAETAT